MFICSLLLLFKYTVLQTMNVLFMFYSSWGVHLQPRYLQASSGKPEGNLEAAVSLLQRVNFAGNMVCKSSFFFFFFPRQDVFSPASFFPPLSSPFPPLFSTTLIHMELRKETAGKDLSREVGYVSESNLNSL